MTLWLAFLAAPLVLPDTGRALEPIPRMMDFRARVAEVDDPASLLGSQLQVGTLLTGSITSVRGEGRQAALAGVERERPHAQAAFIVQAGALVFRSDPAAPDLVIETVERQKNKSGTSPADTFVMHSFRNLPLNGGAIVDEISWQIDDPGGKALAQGAAGRDTFRLSRWQSTHGLTIEGHGPGEDGPRFFIRAHLTEVEAK